MNKQEETIEKAISHLNGYVLILEKEKHIPALAVKGNIVKLKKMLFKIKSERGKNRVLPLL